MWCSYSKYLTLFVDDSADVFQLAFQEEVAMAFETSHSMQFPSGCCIHLVQGRIKPSGGPMPNL